MRPGRSMASALVLTLLLLGTIVGTTWTFAENGGEAVDPFGPPEGPIPFPIIDVSSAFDGVVLETLDLQ